MRFVLYTGHLKWTASLWGIRIYGNSAKRNNFRHLNCDFQRETRQELNNNRLFLTISHLYFKLF